MAEIRVALVDDHPVVLAGIKALLAEASDIELVGEATSGVAALRMIQDLVPDVAVIDISLPDLNGIDLARRAGALAPEVKLLVLTVHEDRAYVQPLLQAGVKGYLLKRSAAEDLVRAIRAIKAGGIYLDPAIADKALSDAGRRSAAGGWDAQEMLSPRETDVVRMTAQGISNKEIAARLDVSVKTVETYKARASDKLGLRNRADIVRYCISQGWLGTSDDA
jgi:DNA-binding NarL/FixJ family response regulator